MKTENEIMKQAESFIREMTKLITDAENRWDFDMYENKVPEIWEVLVTKSIELSKVNGKTSLENYKTLTLLFNETYANE